MKDLIKKYSDRIVEIQKYFENNQSNGSINDTTKFARLRSEMNTLHSVIEELEKFQIPTRESVLAELLNLKCRDTEETIREGEIVAIHDWGIHSSNNVIGYAKFEWDTQYRSFSMETDNHTNVILGTPDFCIIEDNYDAFRTSPRKLTKEEKEKLK